MAPVDLSETSATWPSVMFTPAEPPAADPMSMLPSQTSPRTIAPTPPLTSRSPCRLALGARREPRSPVASMSPRVVGAKLMICSSERVVVPSIATAMASLAPPAGRVSVPVPGPFRRSVTNVPSEST